MAKRRRRGVVLTPEGLQKFQEARLKSEAEHNYSERYTYEKLSDITYLDIHTIKRVIECQEGVDKRTIERLFISFEIELTDSCYTKPNPHKRQNWGESMCVDNFVGREKELATLEDWLLGDRCRVITILAMGGMGKTCLSTKLSQQVQSRYDLVMWCSLRDAPPINEVVSSIIEFFSDDTDINLPGSLKGKITKLIEYLKNLRCLLVLDNIESLLCDGKRAGEFREGYEEYGDFLRRLGDTDHQSNVILTTREKPKQIAVMEGDNLPVRTYRLYGLGEEAGKEVLLIKGLTGSEAAFRDLVNHYGGNALALKVVATTICDLFQGDIQDFLEQEASVFGDIRDLLKQQFDRLTDIEREIVYWLAINREPLSIDDVRADMVSTVPRLRLLEGLESLSRRSLVEQDDSCFTLQNVVMEYVICRFVERVSDEIVSLELKLFRYHAVIKATAKDYIRETQIRLIMEPVLDELMIHFKSQRNIEKRLNGVLTLLREKFSSESCYAAGNILNILCRMKTDFTGYDFSNLAVWQGDLRNSCFHDVNFANADLDKSVFTETFGGVLSVAFSPDGKLLAKGDMNGDIHLYRVSDWQQILSFEAHTDWVTSVAFNPTNNILATASLDKKIKLWKPDDGQLLQVLQEHTNSVESIAFSGDGQLLASGSDDHTVKIWSISTGAVLKTLQENDMVRTVVFCPTAPMVLSGSLDKSLKLWDISTGECLTKFEGHEGGIWSAAIGANGKILASASSDKIIRLWDINTGECLTKFEGHDDAIWSVAIDTYGEILASGSWDRTVRLWDIGTGKCLKKFEGHNNMVRTVAFSPDGEILISGSEDQSLKLWNLETKSCLRTLQGYSDASWSISVCPDGETLASSGDNTLVKLWDINSGQCLDTFEGHNNKVRALAFSPDGKTIASGSDDHTVRIWDRNTGKSKILHGHESWVWSVVYSPDGKLLASGSSDQTLKIWNLKTGHCINTMREENHSILSTFFSPDGKLLATSSADHTVKIWDANTAKCLKTLEGHEGWVWSVAFSPDGNTLSSGSLDGTMRLWNVSTGECLMTLREHQGWLWSVAFSTNGQVVASGSTDRTVKLWNVKTGECFKTLQGHDSGILSVIFDCKSHNVISSSEDKTIRFWDVQTGECKQILKNKKPYEGMIVNNANSLTQARIATLRILGAVAL